MVTKVRVVRWRINVSGVVQIKKLAALAAIVIWHVWPIAVTSHTVAKTTEHFKITASAITERTEPRQPATPIVVVAFVMLRATF